MATNQKTGLGVQGIFQTPEPETAIQEPPKPAAKKRTIKKKLAAESKAEQPLARVTSQTNITLYMDQADWLDVMVLEARKGGDKKFRKAAVARALFDVAQECEVNLEGVTSEEDIKQRFREALRTV